MADEKKEPQTAQIRALPVKCPPSGFQFGGDGYELIDVTVPIGHKMEDVLRPDYWSSVAHRLILPPGSGRVDRAGSIIHLRKEDHSLFAMLYVRAVHKDSLEVAVIKPNASGFCYFGAQDDGPAEMGGFRLQWNPGHKGWDVIRASDNIVVASARDMRTKDDALAWIAKTKAA